MPIINQKAALHSLAERAKDLLRSGERPDSNWLEEGLQRVGKLAPPKEYEHSDQPLVLAALHRFVDLADRLGKDDLARNLIGNHVRWAVTELDSPTVGKLPDRVVELIWYVISFCVTEHRVGGIGKALTSVSSAKSALERHLPDETNHLELRCRVEYALGRHYQSRATEEDLKRAETHYRNALDICSRIANRNQSNDVQYASYRSSIILVGLARVFLNRGQLNDALRELLIAKIILLGTPDALTRSYVDYLIGSILRQQPVHLSAAIDLLKSALTVFRDVPHNRHYIQCRHELAKAYLNANNFQQGIRTLTAPIARSTFQGNKHKTSFSRWDWNDHILHARLRFELERDAVHNAGSFRSLNKAVLDGAEADLRDAIDALAEDARATDIRTRGLIVLCEIALRKAPGQDLEMDRFEALLDCLTTASSKPLDSTDIAWGWLVIAEARLRQNKLNSARAALAAIPRIENEFLSSLQTKLQDDLNTSTYGGIWFSPIRFPETPKHWEFYEWSIKNWLLDELKYRGLNDSQQAEILGIPRNTLRGKSWLESYQRKTRSRTTKRMTGASGSAGGA